MLANNIWELLGEFTETVLFIPYNFLKNNVSGWWTSNIVNIIFILLGFVALFYWMNLMYKYKREGKEDVA